MREDVTTLAATNPWRVSVSTQCTRRAIGVIASFGTRRISLG